MKKSLTALLFVLTSMFGFQGALSVASADGINITFSEYSDSITKVDIDFDFTGMKVGAKLGIDFTSDDLTAVHAAENTNSPRALCFKGGSKDHSRKVVYLSTGGKKTGVQIFKKFTLQDAKNLNTHFSWLVGDGYFAIDESMLAKKTFRGTFYVKVALFDLIETNVLGTTIKNGNVTISSKPKPVNDVRKNRANNGMNKMFVKDGALVEIYNRGDGKQKADGQWVLIKTGSNKEGDEYRIMKADGSVYLSLTKDNKMEMEGPVITVSRDGIRKRDTSKITTWTLYLNSKGWSIKPSKDGALAMTRNKNGKDLPISAKTELRRNQGYTSQLWFIRQIGFVINPEL